MAPSSASAQAKDRLPGLLGLDHVVIGVNDLRGSLLAYARLGFNVIPLQPPAAGGTGGIVDLGNGLLEFATPRADSSGNPEPLTFEGALGQGWEVRSAADVGRYLRDHGGQNGESVSGTFAPPADSTGAAPGAAAGPTFTLTEPRDQPVSGTSIYFVEYDRPKLTRLFDDIVERAGVGDPTDHPNGAVELAYVTIAVTHMEAALEILRAWGLEPKPSVRDERGAETVEVPLPRGKLFLTRPTSNGGIDDFLEEQRSKAPPVGTRFFEGAILSIGIGVRDLNATIDWLTEKNIPYVPMKLPSGTVEVVQGAPRWGLRIEFVQAGPERTARWAGHRADAGGAEKPAGAAGRTAGAAAGPAGPAEETAGAARSGTGTVSAGAGVSR